jgi:hypothetical protein
MTNKNTIHLKMIYPKRLYIVCMIVGRGAPQPITIKVILG